MEPIRLTKENKKYLREYYINLYVLELKDHGDYDDTMYDEIATVVDYMIFRYEKHGNIKHSFPKFMTNFNPIYLKYKNKLILTNEKVELIKQGNTKYLETLIDYQKNVFALNYRLFVLKNNMAMDEELLKKGLDVVDSSIRKYFDENISTNFTIYLTRITQNFFFNNNLKTESVEKNNIIDIKTGKSFDRQKLYDLYYSLACKKVDNTTNLPSDKFNKFMKKIVQESIDGYFEGNEKVSTLRSILEQKFLRLNGNSDQIIVKYNLLFDDFYEESISFLEDLTKKYIENYIKEKNINKISLVYRLNSKAKEIAKNYLDERIKHNCYFSFEKNVISKIKDLLKEEKTKITFDLEQVINGDEEDRKEQIETLKNEMADLKDSVKQKYTFYADSQSVTKRIDDAYNKIIESYVNNAIKKGNVSIKPIKSFMSTRLHLSARKISSETRDKYYKNNIDFLYATQFMDMINNYLNEANLSDEEVRLFIEYMAFAYYTYVKNGSYEKDLRMFLKDMIDSYDYKFAKDVSEIKKYENSNIKVLKRPVIK